MRFISIRGTILSTAMLFFVQGLSCSIGHSTVTAVGWKYKQETQRKRSDLQFPDNFCDLSWKAVVCPNFEE